VARTAIFHMKSADRKPDSKNRHETDSTEGSWWPELPMGIADDRSMTGERLLKGARVSTIINRPRDSVVQVTRSIKWSKTNEMQHNPGQMVYDCELSLDRVAIV
jgi:hypothetical protein